MSPETKKKLKALDKANQWAPAGHKAHQLALATEKAALEGEIVPVTKENLEITIKGALKLFLDGNIQSRRIIEEMKNAGLDMKNLRKSIVEETMANALPRIIGEGDIERLAQLAQMAGETPEQEILDSAKTITRERIIIELPDK